MVCIEKISYEDIQNNLINETNKLILDKINLYNDISEDLNGYWFQTIFSQIKIWGNFFKGENEITENSEGYINLFFMEELINVQILHKVLSELIIYIKKENNVDFVHMQIFFSNRNNYSEMIQHKKTELKLLSIIIGKNLNSIKKLNLPENFVVRKAQKSDEQDILDCLVDAYVSVAEEKYYQRIGIEKFKKNILNYYNSISASQRLVFVMENEGEFCGHISYDISNEDFFSTTNQILLIDLYIVEKFKKQGLLKLLTNFGEYMCEMEGVEKIIGTIEVNNNLNKANSIFSNLKKDGWHYDGLIYIDN
ncbi:GNAT family N-acetyltransferase [Bacillus pseudomycoides]|uniref:GNAT family N-acetyltransferase n=1 Tax=Bacillus pseudomycoides TaxID=64104 RepID=UPI000BFA8322|nr:GNAT family N-acetyltransferase [Bacillus pseudomycoides]PFY79298.1 hypothetical protein COL53_29740 [Bacillus pseudomycoides]